MNFLVENWLAILGFLSAPLAWFFGGKQAKKVELKNSVVSLKNKLIIFHKYNFYEK
jgi:hypothetical protein